MKHVKLLGLIAVAAMALMALLGAGTASATVLCKTTTDPCPAGETYSGTVTVKGCEVTTNNALFGSCVYGAGAGTDIGIVEEGGSGEAAKVSKVISKISGLCPSTVVVEASVVRTTPVGTLAFPAS